MVDCWNRLIFEHVKILPNASQMSAGSHFSLKNKFPLKQWVEISGCVLQEVQPSETHGMKMTFQKFRFRETMIWIAQIP